MEITLGDLYNKLHNGFVQQAMKISDLPSNIVEKLSLRTPVSETPLAWLDRRISEMRVRI